MHFPDVPGFTLQIMCPMRKDLLGESCLEPLHFATHQIRDATPEPLVFHHPTPRELPRRAVQIVHKCSCGGSSGAYSTEGRHFAILTHVEGMYSDTRGGTFGLKPGCWSWVRQLQALTRRTTARSFLANGDPLPKACHPRTYIHCPPPDMYGLRCVVNH